MEIDPNLLVLKPVSELETVNNPTTGSLLFYDGGDELKKTSVAAFYNAMESAYLGIATTTTTPPATGAWWYKVDTAGTYTNFSGIVVTEADLDVVNGVANNRVILEVQDGVATKRVERVKGDTGPVSYDEQVRESLDGFLVHVPSEEVPLNFYAAVGYLYNNDTNVLDVSSQFSFVYKLTLPLWGVKLHIKKLSEGTATLLGYKYENGVPVFVTNLMQDVPEGDYVDITISATEYQAISFMYKKDDTQFSIIKITPEQSAVRVADFVKEKISESWRGQLDVFESKETGFIFEPDVRPDIGYTISPLIRVYAGDVIKGKLRGDFGRIAVGFFSDDKSYVEPLMNYNAQVENIEVNIVVEQDGFIRAQYRHYEYPYNDLELIIIGKEKYSTRDIEKLREDWLYLPSNGFEKLIVGKSIKYDSISYPTAEMSPVLDYGWTISEFIPVKVGDYIDASLRGDSGRIAIGFYAEKTYDSYERALERYRNDLPHNTRTIIEIDKDGFVVFQYRHYEYPADDLFFRYGEKMKADAQFILDKLPKNIDVTGSSLVCLSALDFAKIKLKGILPTDVSDEKIPTTMKISILENDITILVAEAEVSIQGHGSATYAKKGYKVKLKNANGDKLLLKVGDMVPCSTWNIKAYATDTTHTRDLGLGRIWADMINQLPYPENRLKRVLSSKAAGQREAAIHYSDAKFHTDGFPCEVTLNSTFEGLYTMRLSKVAENYAMEVQNKNHIYLDSTTYTAYLSQPFDAVDWEAKSPKMSNYDESMPIPDTNVLAAINRLWSFTTDLNDKANQHADYIYLNHWVIYIIFCEVFSNRDINGNNYNLITHDGLHWSIVPYDLDITMGLNPWDGAYSINEERPQQDITFDIWPAFKSKYQSEIKNIYTMLRNNSFLSVKNLMPYFAGIGKNIPRSLYTADREKWGNIWTDGEPNLDQIELFISSKLSFLDTLWRNPTP